MDRLSPNATGTTETRNLWMVPLLGLLGYDLELARSGEVIEGKNYPISHRDKTRDGLPIHLIGWNDSLDKKRADSGLRMSPHALLQEYLNLTEHLYALVSNGRLLRLLRDSTRLIKLSYIEFDLERMFDDELFSDFAVLYRLLHASRLPARQTEAGQAPVEKYHQNAIESGARIRDGLRDAVEDSLVALGNGFLQHPCNEHLRAEIAEGRISAQAYYQLLLRLIYRVLFLMVIEERKLIFPGDTERWKIAYYLDYYSVQRLRKLAIRRHLRDKRHHDLWEALKATFSLFEESDYGSKLGIAPLAGHLFGSQALGLLTSAQIDNSTLLQVFENLSYFTHPESKQRLAVNYGALATEEFGSVYESLLELHPTILPGVMPGFVFKQAAGNERKTTGSYYTPSSLVECLLDSALDPVLEERASKWKELKYPSVDAALLSLKVCDPACGSGHFLIAAAQRIARRIAKLRAGGDEPPVEDSRHALREVISHCLYGVDVNPMSVELCKVTLWLEATEPGKPLSFLDHHIQCGNSLLGATPRVLADGLPDDSFKPLTGDDPDICKEAKKRNKSERQQLALFHGTDTAPWQQLGNLPAAMLEVGTMSDDTAAALHRKEQRYSELILSTGYLNSRFLADAWCAAFVWKKTRDLPYPITNDVLRKIESNPHDCAPWMREEIERLRDRYQFFHWNLAFPEVFPVPEKGQRPANEHGGWSGGFDVILGNPPWDKVQPEEEKFFASLRPDIANAANAKARKELIENLPKDDPITHDKWATHKRISEGWSQLIKASGAFPLSSEGNLNTYRIFTELASITLAQNGRAGLIVQTGLATQESGKELFDNLLTTGRLIRFLDFENRYGFFQAVDSRFRFCLLTISARHLQNREHAEFGWLLHRLDELSLQGRLIHLCAEDLELFNPTSRTCPVFTSERDLAISRNIYGHSQHVFADGKERFGDIDLLGELFNLTRDSKHFLAAEAHADSDVLPLYEAKYFHQFDHRFATLTNGEVEESPCTLKRRADFSIRTSKVVAKAEIKKRLDGRGIRRDWLAGFRRIASSTNERTTIMCVFPVGAVGNTINLVFGLSPSEVAALVANANSFVFDYCCRQKVSGTDINIWIFKQLTVIPLATYAEPCAWAAEAIETLRDWLLPRVLELTYTAWDLEPFARDCGWFGPPFVWDEARRFQLRCELDAAFIHLYGLSRADAAYILDTFPIVRRKDIAATEVKDAAGNVIQDGTYRTKDTILALYDQLAECAVTSKPFVSPLHPPPGTLAAAHRMSWRDLPMEPPATHREPLPLPFQYVLTVMTEMVLQAGGSLPWTTLRTATDLLANRKKLARLAEPQFGTAATDWLALNGDTFDATQRFDQLSGLCHAGRIRVVSQDAELVFELLQLEQHADFPHVRFDARLALAVANELAAAAPDAAAEQERKKVASLVPA